MLCDISMKALLQHELCVGGISMKVLLQHKLCVGDKSKKAETPCGSKSFGKLQHELCVLVLESFCFSCPSFNKCVTIGIAMFSENR